MVSTLAREISSYTDDTQPNRAWLKAESLLMILSVCLDRTMSVDIATRISFTVWEREPSQKS